MSQANGSKTPAVVGIVMGVAGVGKTAVGRLAAERLGWEFVDGDDHHPVANVRKMSRGIPLTDGDRIGWLEVLRTLTRERLVSGRPTIITCSALKEAYRDLILQGNDGAIVVYLKAPANVVEERIRNRTGHFFDASLLESQYEALEEPEDAVIIDATQPLETVVERVARALADA